ncbi:hypothetical protein CDEST_02938 [Colletotrichum destructivum]|uniref:AraC family transcriptional regulator n=1 Tax=Colletotrichum destructivum TaxID=34406 RepID=A0AAX4I3S5_9PEZI|nr:hypothetical protein CDEST_02938 [Colletotrichum destructivum]
MTIIETRLSAPSFSLIEPNPPVVEALSITCKDAPTWTRGRMRFPGSHTHTHTHTHFCLDGFIVA